jgi:D-ribose pyranase
MRRDGLWHPRLLELITAAGHTDLIVVSDAGLPIPPGVESIDLVWRAGEPRFLPVLQTVLQELVVEHAWIARQLSDEATIRGIEAVLPGFAPEVVDHQEFKVMTARARAAVRTGEVTPYANILLQAGVPY